ncbi:GTP cyclohydrolase FolE2 [Coprothermobacter platensis]|uniref:GTP cyclohydrolase FolE2 n=1 Tax=Coprothermobacter platensis TaxID=108819 RepID=UPI000369BC47|nr:GTP cyclohydrolase FolE2 [Coprothermobacter platensis]
MRDVQSEHDPRNVPLDYVGIEDVRLPIKVRTKNGQMQSTVGTFAIGVDFPYSFRGTHMSRFMEVLYQHLEEISQSKLRVVLEDIKDRLQATKALIEVGFPYAIDKLTPVTRLETIMYVDASFKAELNKDGYIVTSTVTVPVHTLCPCSKDISDFGAHNQRADVTVSWRGNLWIEDVVSLVEGSASQPLYPLLKRPDEKYVTEKAYLNPKFVEDIAKDLFLKLDPLSPCFKIKVVSHESIHPHNAVAVKEKKNVDENHRNCP